MTQNKYPRSLYTIMFTLGCLATALGLGVSVHAAEAQLSGDRFTTTDGDLIVHPVNHASFLMSWKGQTIYVDPVGGSQRYTDLPRPDLILLTDIHGDHLNQATLSALAGPKTTLVAPPAVVNLLPSALRDKTIVLTNGQQKLVLNINLEALPMYNLSPDRSSFHAKGRGNGYVLTVGGKRVYISGDTEDIPEMLALKNIEVAFLCMNLPYTMTVEQAAGAVRKFQPKVVYPYHYRGSDLAKFAKLVGTDVGVEVRLREWYK